MPIYNPASAASVDIHTQYFTDLGLLTGLDEIIKVTGGNTYPTPDVTKGTKTITDNVAKFAAILGYSWLGFNFPAVTKLLTICYTKPTYNTEIFHGTEDCDVASGYGTSDNGYFSLVSNNGGTYQYDITGGGLTSISADTTVFAPDTFGDYWASCIGIASYMQFTGAGDADQRIFLQCGSTSEWFPVSHTTDETHEEFKSVGFGGLGYNARFMTPVYIYGA